MIDKEKVIKGIQECDLNGGLIGNCPYKGILSLLKEQEAVEPIKKEMVEITARYEFDCPCGAPLLIGQPYCADCGRSVKWNA